MTPEVVYVLQARYAGGRTYDPRNARTESGIRWLDYETAVNSAARFTDRDLALEAAEMLAIRDHREIRVIARVHHPVVASFDESGNRLIDRIEELEPD